MKSVFYLAIFNKKESGYKVSPGRSPLDGMAPFSPCEGGGAHFEGGTGHSEPRKRLDTAFKAAQTTFQGRSAPFRHVPCYNSI